MIHLGNLELLFTPYFNQKILLKSLYWLRNNNMPWPQLTLGCQNHKNDKVFKLSWHCDLKLTRMGSFNTYNVLKVVDVSIQIRRQMTMIFIYIS